MNSIEISSNVNKSSYIHKFGSYDILHEKHNGKEDAVFKKILMRRIKTMQKKGFCIDFLNLTNSKIEELLERPSMAGKIRVLKKWDKWDGTKHKFIQFDPSGWTFTYVCFQNMFKVGKIDGGIVYANQFWGILMVNDEEKLTLLVQWDDFWQCLKVSWNNIYDGGNSLAVLLPPTYRLLCNHGTIVDTFDEFVNVNKQLMVCAIDEEIETIAALEDEVRMRRKKMTEIRHAFSKDFKSLGKAMKKRK